VPEDYETPEEYEQSHPHGRPDREPAGVGH
jgi:hypothetical protein